VKVITLEKPKPRTVVQLNWIECRNYINEKLRYDIEGCAPNDYRIYEDQTGNKCPDRLKEDWVGDGDDWESQCTPEETKWIADFKAWSDNIENTVDFEYKDFWTWICGRFQINNGCYIYFTDDEFLGDDETEQWVKDIYNAFLTEFAEYADEDGTIAFWVEW
jgi:hypothetical protein